MVGSRVGCRQLRKPAGLRGLDERAAVRKREPGCARRPSACVEHVGLVPASVGDGGRDDLDQPVASVRHRRKHELVLWARRPPTGCDRLGGLGSGERAGERVGGHDDLHVTSLGSSRPSIAVRGSPDGARVRRRRARRWSGGRGRRRASWRGRSGGGARGGASRRRRMLLLRLHAVEGALASRRAGGGGRASSGTRGDRAERGGGPGPAGRGDPRPARRVAAAVARGARGDGRSRLRPDRRRASCPSRVGDARGAESCRRRDGECRRDAADPRARGVEAVDESRGHDRVGGAREPRHPRRRCRRRRARAGLGIARLAGVGR